MIEKKPIEEAKLLNHEYDGIQELDNKLPNWWLAILYLSIAFSGAYWAYYELGPGKSIDQEYRAHVEAAQMAKLMSPSALEASEEDLVKLVAAPGKREKGETVFQSKCASCHGTSGEGSIGPNLTDDYWLHGAKLTEVSKTIRNGVPEKGMPPWSAILSPDEVQEVLAYIRGVRGKIVTGAKAPQGELVKF